MTQTPTVSMVPLTVSMVPVHLIDPNPIQPPDRANEGIEGLSQDILTTELIVPVVLVAKRTRFTLIDGHRRVAAATRLHVPEVPACVMKTDQPVTLLFLTFNRSMRHVKAAQLYYAWAHETPDDRETFLKLITGPTRKNIQAMVTIFGRSDAVRLADGSLSPHISKFVDDVRRLLVTHRLEALPSSQVGHWVINHAQTNAINKLRRDPYLKKRLVVRLRQAIEANQPFEQAKRIRKLRKLRAVG